VFVPAGYIQSPLFDPHADAAINYGALGSIIGHEIGHGFDDQGSRSDGAGRLRDWWSAADRAAFDKLATRMAEQYSKYEYFPGLFVNGRATLGENIGDLAGVVLAYHAYMRSLAGRKPPVLDGFTGAQRVFLGRAQARRFKRTEEFERMGLLSGVHVPMPLRVNGVVRNIDEWYEAFNVGPGDKMYLPPQERVRIW
jgi:predicted metalloendopeptidase